MIGTLAGAVMYQICFPASLDCERILEAFGSEVVLSGSKPFGGWKGAGGAAVLVFAGTTFFGVDVAFEGLVYISCYCA